MANQDFGDINIAKTTGEAFNNALVGDMLVYTESAQQRIHIGTELGASAMLSISKSNVVVAGSIIPNSNVVYDLGSYDSRFRDLYLSGNTIDLGGTMIQNNGQGITFTDSNNSLRSIIVDAIVIGDPTTSNNVTIRKTETGTLDIATATGMPSDITASNVFTVNMVASNISAGTVNASLLTQNGIGVALVNQPLALNSVATVNVLDSNITRAKLAANSVGSAQIIDSNITQAKLAANSVGSTQIIDSNITLAKLAANSIGSTQIIDSTITQAKLAVNSVGSTQIIDSNITQAKLAANSVGSTQILDSNVTQVKLAANSVGSTQIIDNTITQAKLAVNSVGSSQILDSNVTQAKLTANSVGSTQIMDSNITQAKMAINSIGNLQMLDLSVTQAKLGDYSVGTLQLIDSNVTQSKLANNVIIASHISTGAVTQTKLASNSVGTLQLVDSNVTFNKLAANSVSTLNVIDGSVTQQKIANNAIGTNQIADGTVTLAKFATSTTSDALLSKATFQMSNLSVTTTINALNGAFSNLDVTNSLTIGGNLIVNGSTTTIDTQTVLIEDNIITLNKNQTGTPAAFLQSGIEVERGDQSNYYFMFDEASSFFKVGLSNSLQAVCTRDDTLTSGYPYFDGAQAKLVNRTFTTSDLPDNIVTTSKIVNGTITGAKLASNIYTSNIGIGNTNPQYPLDVSGSAVISGSVGIGTSNAPAFKLQVVGDIQATGNVIAYSDERLKTDLQVIENALDKVIAIHGYTFKRIAQQTDKREVGVIAQEIAQVLPEVVIPDRDGYFSVAYGNITALLIEAFHDVHKRLSNLESIVANIGYR